MMKKILYLILFGVMLWGCAPDYPNDARHQDVVSDDCVACHIDRMDPDAPHPPDSHIDGEDPDSRHENCKKCHEKAE